MRWLLHIVFLLGLTVASHAQETTIEDGKTYLENLLQDLLSGDDHTVEVTGFAGALSSQATLKKMTIADKSGVWLTLNDATLIWSRSALLSGYLDITELSAKSIEVDRLPQSEKRLSPQDANAISFSLPELPVSVDIRKLDIQKISLEPAIIGEPASFTAIGQLSLNDGQGDTELSIQRLDRDDSLTLTASFSNQTRILALDLDLKEAREGLISTLLRIPEHPSLELQVTGDAPVSSYTAKIRLASDGLQRFGGEFRISALSKEADLGYEFSADLGGDVRPLFIPDLHQFFGERSTLNMQGRRFSNGRVMLDKLDLTSGAMQFSSEVSLAPEGWPERFGLYGEIRSDSPVRLPISGSNTTIRSAEFAASYDASRSESWSSTTEISGLVHDALSVESAYLKGQGTISPHPLRKFTASLTFDTQGVTHSDPALASAIGERLTGSTDLLWQPERPLQLNNLIMRSGETYIAADGAIDGLSSGFAARGEIRLSSTDLSRFGALAERDIRGEALGEFSGNFVPLTGAFDIEARAITQNLSVDEPRLDPLLVGRSQLNTKLNRSVAGTRLEYLTVHNDRVEARAAGRLDADSGELDVSGILRDISLVEPDLSGSANVKSAFQWLSGEGVQISQLDIGFSDATVSASGKFNPEDPDMPVEGQLSLSASNLSRFAKLAGRDLAGNAKLSLQGSGSAKLSVWELTGELDGTGVRSGISELDRLIAGDVSAAFSGKVGGDTLDLRYLKLTSPRLRLNASGDGPGAPIAVSGRLSDLAVVAPGFSGPVTARGTVTLQNRDATRSSIALTATGPGNSSAGLQGNINDHGQSLNLSVVGNAPMGLANRFISPQSVQGQAQFNLTVNGPPRLDSLSGEIRFSDARAALPNLNYALNNLSGTAEISDGRAAVDVTGDAGTGGSFQVSGPVGLSNGFPADLNVTLSALGLFDPTLYQTNVNGRLQITGNLLGGAFAQGVLNLGPTKLRVPSGSGTITGTLPDINHLYEPAKVRQTRQRAGLIDVMKSSQAIYPIDIVINAPKRIFVRGRGLDAELGGQVRITGTTSDMKPSGVFELIRGRIDILGKRLVLSEGLIDLRGALDPFLRFVAETSVDDVMVQVILEGLASEPTVTFASSPELPQEEVVARLLFGRNLASMSAFQAAQLVSAVATLSGRYSGGITGKLRDSLGLSDLDISTTDEGTTQFKAGAYVSKNVYSEITADSDGKQEINLNLDLSKSITLKGHANTEGNTGIGIYFEKDY